jgi:hypothetical protein
MKILAFSSRSRPQPRAASAPGRRLRLVGVCALVLGLGTAGVVYELETRASAPDMEELMPGYSQANSRQMGIYYGHAGEIMWAWREDLARPGTQAAIIVAIASFVALGCFRAAWLDAEDARKP